MTLDELCTRIGADRKAALHVVRPWQDGDADLTRGVSTLVLLWHVLKTLGYQSEDCHEICRFVSGPVFRYEDDQGHLMVQIVDNRWVGTNAGGDVLDLEDLTTGNQIPTGQAMIGIGLCVDELWRRYLADA